MKHSGTAAAAFGAGLAAAPAIIGANSPNDKIRIGWIGAGGRGSHLMHLAMQNPDVLVLYDMWQPITDEAKSDFVARLKEGKGLVALHHCLASYQQWPEYAKIIGGQYHLVYAELGHDHFAFENLNYRRLVAQAIRWTAKRD